MIPFRSTALATAILSTVLAGAVLAPPAEAAVVLGPLETISAAVDDKNQAGWWSPIDEFNGRTYLTYNTDVLDNPGRHNVWVTRRDAAGSYVRGCLPNTTGTVCAEFTDDLGHNQPSLAVDGDGYIHVFAAMHNSAGITYYRSVRPGDPTEFARRTAEMPDGTLGFTYPNVSRAPNGDLWLIIRARSVLTRAGARLYHWTNATNSWSLVGGTAFAYQLDPERTVYPDDVQVAADGVVHIAFEWAYAATGVRHEGSYLQYRPATNTFHVANGTQVAIPTTPATPGLVFQPLMAGEAYNGDFGVQSAKLALRPSGTAWTPVIAYRYREVNTPTFKVRRARFVNGVWARDIVYGGPSQTTAALDVTTAGTSDRIYYVKTDAGGTAIAAEQNGASWVETPVAAGKLVQRLAVITRANGTDLAYLCAPTAISARRGELYYREIGR